MDWLRKEVERELAKPIGQHGTNQHTRGHRNTMSKNASVQGDSPSYKLARLKRDRPDLLPNSAKSSINTRDEKEAPMVRQYRLI